MPKLLSSGWLVTLSDFHCVGVSGLSQTTERHIFSESYIWPTAFRLPFFQTVFFCIFQTNRMVVFLQECTNKVWMRQETFLDSRQNWTGKLTTQSRLKVGWKKIYWVIKFWQRMIPSCILKVYPAYASSELCEFISLASSCVHRQTEAKISRASIWIHIWPTVNFTDWAEPRVCMQIQPKQYCSNKLHTAGHLPHC